MQTGRGTQFRHPSAIERLASSAGRLLPPSWRCRLRERYERTLTTLRPERLVCTLPGGERIRLLPSLRQVTWNTDEYDAFRRDVRPGDVVFDVGANLGAYTMLFAQWAGERGRVFAFEPAPEPFAGLSELLEANQLRSRVTLLQAAVSSREGSASFLAEGVDGSSRIAAPGEARTMLTVPTVTIDAVCARERVVPRLIKIDAEGAELDVLRGARATVAAAGSALKLYVEMHPHLWAGFGVSRADIEAELALQGLRAERLDGDPAIWNIEGVCLRLVPCAS
jgi:FkbM family methyltransferase